MELLDRYLQAVRFWLPKAQRQDIITELSEDIRSQIEERESGLGRKLNEAEIEAMLKQRGSPILVAERYLPPQHLIGPVLFPIYWLVLRMAALFYFVPWIAVWICFVLFVPSYRAEHPGLALLRTWSSLWLTALVFFAVITLAFALLEKHHARTAFLANWNPRKLPPVRDPNRIRRSSSIAELVASTLVLLWWVNVLRFPAIPDLRIALAPAMSRYFYWPIVVFYLAVIAVAAVNSFRPWWTRRRAAIRLAIDTFGLVLVGLLLNLRTLAEITSPKLSDAQLAQAEKWLSFGWALSILFPAGISFIARAIQDARRAQGKEPIQNWATRTLAGE